jgi:branched-chain amino acid aminotransferase
MNICFVYEGGHIVTPPLSGSILAGVTRDSVITLGRSLGYEVSEEMIDVEEMVADLKAGKITEVFGCGTAAVIAPVGKFGYKDQEIIINNYEVGPISRRLYHQLTDIQYGRIPDPFGWIDTLKVNGS